MVDTAAVVADKIVRDWIKAHHRYLKDGGGTTGMHAAPRDALIAAVAAELRPHLSPQKTVLVGPEGGMSPDELHDEMTRLRGIGETTACVGPTIPTKKSRKKKALPE